jgi:hypothetical protein
MNTESNRTLLNKKLALSVSEFVQVSGIGKSAIYEAIRQGRLTARKHGARTLILMEDGEAFLSGLPTIKPL